MRLDFFEYAHKIDYDYITQEKSMSGFDVDF